MTTAIWWLRRDLRLTDNPALTAALVRGASVIPVFVLDPALLDSPNMGQARLAFLFGGLHALAAALRERGSCLIVRRGNPAEALAALAAEVNALAIFAEEDFSPYARRRDASVAVSLPLHLTSGATLHHPDAVLKADGTPYVRFTPFMRFWRSLPPPHAEDIPPTPDRIPTPPDIATLPLPEAPSSDTAALFRPGEAEARCRLDAFVDGPIYDYAETRSRLDVIGTAQLSPYLRFGMLSARQVIAAALQARAEAPEERAREGTDSWLSELIWREFYAAILYHFPHVLGRSFREEYEGIPWANDEAAFAAWCEGQTGYPVVDSAMRQLAAQGWISNRARMIAASFLVKDLLIDWRWGERWFMQQLVDGDPAANNGNWQWVAGTGTDAAPYFRIFNPITQGKTFDPEGAYVREWVPQLANVPDKFIHTPWMMPPGIQREATCRTVRDYPPPIVDHAWARERALAAYGRAGRE